LDSRHGNSDSSEAKGGSKFEFVRAAESHFFFYYLQNLCVGTFAFCVFHKPNTFCDDIPDILNMKKAQRLIAFPCPLKNHIQYLKTPPSPSLRWKSSEFRTFNIHKVTTVPQLTTKAGGVTSAQQLSALSIKSKT
jgi:hypothetical protein